MTSYTIDWTYDISKVEWRLPNIEYASRMKVKKPWPLLRLPNGVRCEEGSGAQDEEFLDLANYNNAERRKSNEVSDHESEYAPQSIQTDLVQADLIQTDTNQTFAESSKDGTTNDGDVEMLQPVAVDGEKAADQVQGEIITLARSVLLLKTIDRA